MDNCLKLTIFIIIILQFTSCKDTNDPARIYLDNSINIYLTVSTKVNKTSKKIKETTLPRLNQNYKPDSKDILKLERELISLSEVIKISIMNLESIGYFENDTLLYRALSRYLLTHDRFFKDSMNELLNILKEDEWDNYSFMLFYSSSINLANSSIDLYDSIIEFTQRYNVLRPIRKIRRAKSNAQRFLEKSKMILLENCVSGDCQDGYGIQKDSEGSQYEGQFKNGLFHGIGRIEYIDGEYYEGSFYKNEFEGNGFYRWKSGTIYKGAWKEGSMNGEGLMVYPEGDSVYGVWKNGELQFELK